MDALLRDRGDHQRLAQGQQRQPLQTVTKRRMRMRPSFLYACPLPLAFSCAIL